MKNLVLVVLLMMVVNYGFTQNNFLRVYDLNNAKFAKGYVINLTDSSIVISFNKKLQEINFNKIGLIKTKHSFGHAVLKTSLIIGAISTIGLFALEGTPIFGFSTGFGTAVVRFKAPPSHIVAAGMLNGFYMGATIEGLSSISGVKKKPMKFEINGQYKNWQKAKNLLEALYINTTTEPTKK